MTGDISSYHKKHDVETQRIFKVLYSTINQELSSAESKLWHGHPVWFLNGNPIVGYSLQKPGVRLMFWSGADFDEPKLNVIGKKFKDASVFYNKIEEIEKEDLKRWLKKSEAIQWDYKNIIKRKGILVKIDNRD